MSRRAHLKPDEVICGQCKRPMLAAAAVEVNGQPFHPIGCFEPALAQWRRKIDELVVRNAGAFELTISMKSAPSGVAGRLERLAGDVVRARRAAR